MFSLSDLADYWRRSYEKANKPSTAKFGYRSELSTRGAPKKRPYPQVRPVQQGGSDPLRNNTRRGHALDWRKTVNIVF